MVDEVEAYKRSGPRCYLDGGMEAAAQGSGDCAFRSGVTVRQRQLDEVLQRARPGAEHEPQG